jgi:hypothetical protein
MRSFHQSTILHQVDCFLVYTPEQQELFSSTYTNVFTLKSNPKEVAPVIQKAKSIYVHPDGFDYWIDILQVLHKKNPLPLKLFVIAGSDYTITDEHIEFWTIMFPTARFWIQNYTGSHQRCRIFPLGVNESIEMNEQEKTSPIVISHFNPLNSKERDSLKKYLDSEPSLQQYCLPNMEMKDFLVGISKAHFSVCPQGNGYDSFRFWESLSVGAIPLVLNTYYIEALMENHPELPFMVLEKWEDLPAFLHSDIQKVYDHYMGMSNLEIVTEEYWKQEYDRIVGTHTETAFANTIEEVSPSDTAQSNTQQGTG